MDVEQAPAPYAPSDSPLRDVFMSSAVGIAILTLEARFLDVNKFLCSMTGYSKEDLCDRDWLAFTHVDDRPAVKAQLDQLLIGRATTFVLENRCFRKDARMIWLRSSFSLVRDGQGRPQQIIALCEDTTERRQVRELRDRLAAIVDCSEDAIIGKTLDGVITSWNSGAERLYGYRARDVIGQPIALLVPEDRSDELPAILGRLARGERIEHYETTRRRRDGRLVDVSVSISPIRDATGKIIGASAIARDISEKKRLERLQDEFLALAAHELRTPITSIKGFAQVIQRRGNTDPLLDRIVAQVDRMDRLVRELLQASRLNAGQFELRHTEVDLTSLVRRCVAEVRTAGASQVFELAVPAGPVLGMWDADRLEQVMHNLLNNAVKYSAEGAPVRISIQKDEVDVRVSVADQGVGVAEEERPKLFERFYRAPSTERLSGLGLGLYLTRTYVEAHGGRIWVESDGPGRGSCFFFELPIHAPE